MKDVSQVYEVWIVAADAESHARKDSFTQTLTQTMCGTFFSLVSMFQNGLIEAFHVNTDTNIFAVFWPKSNPVWLSFDCVYLFE